MTAVAEPSNALAQVRALFGPSADIGLRRLVTGPKALDRLGELVRETRRAGGPIVVLTDATLKRAYGTDLTTAVLSRLDQPKPVVAGTPGHATVADPATVADAVARTAGAGVLVTLGSGTISDIGKVAAARNGLPHVVVQTAASVNGYANDHSVLLLNGVKTTVPSAWPDVLLIDEETLAGAPPELTRAGFGDLISVYTGSADWALAGELGVDHGYRPDLARLLSGAATAVLPQAGALPGSAAAVAALAHGLTLGGLVMGMAGQTAPSSGTEHAISHLLDMAAGATGRPHALHGAQVGVAALVAAAIWDHLRARLTPSARVDVPEEAAARARVLAAFAGLDPGGAMGERCWQGYAAKLRSLDAGTLTEFLTRWPAWADAAAPRLEALAGALRQAGAPTRFSDLDPAANAERARWAIATAPLLRARLGIADLAVVTGLWTEADIDAVLDRLARVGAGL
ncbi:iron-containing alcohol dehydrogenase [Streptosporangiaceae bacterium NEAU-GS5]|nr:iron-containing alcohol dehydrogenase [Streptosporangiaceae bacterium NEAU-GS5]